MKTVLGVLGALALVGVIVFTVVGSAPRIEELRGGSQGQSPQAMGDLTELTQRLIAPPFPFPDGSTPTATLYPSTLPKGAPFDMPLPPNARLIGSVLRTRGSVTSFDVVLDVPGAPDASVAFYEQELGKSGFTAPAAPVGQPAGGFVSSTGPAGGKLLCKSDLGPYVTVTAYAKPSGPNDVRVSYSGAITAGANVGTPCSPRNFGPAGQSKTRLPVLKAPDGVVLQGSGSSFGGNREQSDATSTTSKRPGELESNFAQQLVAAGWTRLAGRDDGALAWSTWKVPGDSDFQGLLMVVETAGANRRSLLLRAESATGF